jgi:glycosyltransferase involved in cell wall biosynthesis
MLTFPRLRQPVDLWHYPHPFQMALLRREPLVLMLPDVIPLTHAIGVRNRLARGMIRAVWRRACGRADAFVANSAATRDAFEAMLGIPRELVRVTHLAPDPSFAAPTDAADVAGARARWGLPERVLLYVGMSQPHKNLDRLLEAVALLAREYSASALGLAIVGPNVFSERRRLARRIRELRLGGHVHFLDRLPDPQLRVAYHAADVVVQPSLVEGFGLTVLEAMQCGAPVVASDIPAFREIAGDAALLVDPLDPEAIADGARRVLSDARLAESLRVRGRTNAARFSWRQAARDTLSAYQVALERSEERVRATTRRPSAPAEA